MMNAIFHELIGIRMKVYINDVVVKSRNIDQHLADLEQTFIKMRLHNLKINLANRVFRVLARNFLNFLDHHKGVKVNKNKTKVVLEVKPP